MRKDKPAGLVIQRPFSLPEFEQPRMHLCAFSHKFTFARHERVVQIHMQTPIVGARALERLDAAFGREPRNPARLAQQLIEPNTPDTLSVSGLATVPRASGTPVLPTIGSPWTSDARCSGGVNTERTL